MRRHTISAISLFVACWAVSAGLSPCSGQITFEKTYGGMSDDVGYSVLEALDGGYVVAGCVGCTSDSGSVYLLKTDLSGNPVLRRTYGGSSQDVAYCVREMSDGGYIMAGGTQPFGMGNADIYLIRTDSLGDTLWTRTYGGPNADEAHSVELISDGGYVVAGYTIPSGESFEDFYLLKLDSLGDTLWTRTYGDSCIEIGRSVLPTPDDGYVVVGESECVGVGSRNLYVIKVDSSGDTVWTRTIGGPGLDAGYAVRQSSDDGYIVCGKTSSFGAGAMDVYLITVDAAGDTGWTRAYGGAEEDAGLSVERTADSGYVIVGNTTSFGAGGSNLYLIKTDSLGNTLWERTYGGSSGDWGASVQQTADGGYIITGYTYSFGAGGTDIYLVKTDANGLTGIEDKKARASRSSFSLFQSTPDPFRHSATISYCLPFSVHVILDIYDITGRLVETLVDQIQQSGVHQVRWDRKDNPSGVYFCRLKACPEPAEGRSRRAGEFVKTRKMVLIE